MGNTLERKSVKEDINKKSEPEIFLPEIIKLIKNKIIEKNIEKNIENIIQDLNKQKYHKTLENVKDLEKVDYKGYVLSIYIPTFEKIIKDDFFVLKDLVKKS
jgi:hypothetical protein